MKRNKFYSKKRTEDVLFCILVTGALLFAGGLLFLHAVGLDWIAQGGPCNIYRLTGWYCPGCGGTRACRALLRGEFLTSLYYHPAVPYLAVWTFVFVIRQTLHYLSKGRIRGFTYHGWHMWIAVFLFVLNFVIKNAAQLV